jgi:hypothetical protein
MSQLLQLRRGTTAQHSTFTGAVGELTIDTDKDVPVVHDGSTAGGFPLAKASSVFLADGTTPMTGSLTLGGAGTGVIFEGTTADAHESTLVAGEPTSDVTVTMPITTTTLAGLAVAETFTAPQRGTLTTDNDGSFDQNVTNNFKCTPTATFALTFTNHTSGQAGNVILVNTGGYAVTAAATTKIATATLTAISTAGTYLLGYVDDGTNAYVTASGALV